MPVARLATVTVAAAAPAATRTGTAVTEHAAPRPHVIPVTFALAGECIFTAVDAKPKTTRELQRLRNITANPAVAVLADHYEDDWTRLWWVRADGRASVIADPGQMARPLRLLRQRYPQYRLHPPPGPVICVAVASWTGWAASHAGAG